MAEHTHHEPKPEVFDGNDTGAWHLILLVGAALGFVVSAIYAFIPHLRTQFAFSWLFAFMYFFTLCAGALFWVLVHHTTDAEWSVVVRRILENLAGLLPIAMLFILPAVLFAGHIWKWWTIPVGADELLDRKRPYLTHTFFFIRLIGYFIALSAVALSLRRNSIRQDANGSPSYTVTMRKVSFAGLPIFGVALTFGAVDWVMGLDYKWYSTMWGVYIFAGAAGAAMSLLVLIITALKSKGYLANVITLEHYHIMGKWMLAFSIFWAYIGFSQYMLIWYANIPEETEFFIRRNIESWHSLSLLLVIGRFFLPFPLLLLQWTKKVPKVLCCVAAWIVVMQLLDLYILIMPMLDRTGFRPSPLDICAPLAIGCTLAILFLRALPKSNLIPIRDPRLPESLRLTN